LERSGKGSCGIQRPECQELSAVEAAHSTTHYGEAQWDTDSIYILPNMLINVCRRSAATHGRPGLKNKGGKKIRLIYYFPLVYRRLIYYFPLVYRQNFNFACEPCPADFFTSLPSPSFPPFLLEWQWPHFSSLSSTLFPPSAAASTPNVYRIIQRNICIDNTASRLFLSGRKNYVYKLCVCVCVLVCSCLKGEQPPSASVYGWGSLARQPRAD
jgi:hypothetical protein